MIMNARRRKISVVLVPFSYQGHMTPMLQLGSVLHSRGFSVAVAHTGLNPPSPSNHPEFAFLHLEEEEEAQGRYNDTSLENTVNLIRSMNENLEAPFFHCLARMKLIDGNNKSPSPPTCIVIYDPIMRFAASVASQLRVPSLALRTTSAAYVQMHDVWFRLLERKVLPIPESRLRDPIPDEPPLVFEDLPFQADREIPGPTLDFQRGYMDTSPASAVIWNTADVFDHSPLQRLRQKYKAPIFPIGPLNKLAPNVATSLIEEHEGCLSWLDTQPRNSVMYVSFGSMAVIDVEELIEMAKGLVKSGQPFLWAIRPSMLSSISSNNNNSNNNSSNMVDTLPDLFAGADPGRACVVGWAPQKRVLEHPSVGGFFTHAGYNSMLESLCVGVPMLCRPCFGDHIIDARYITDVWRVGIRLENGSGSDVVARAVRSLMVGEEGKEARKRAGEMKEEVERCVADGGSSAEALDRLVEFMVELSERD